MYPATFPQTQIPTQSPYGLGINGQLGNLGQLPAWQGSPFPSGPQQQYGGDAAFAPQGFLGGLIGSTAGRLLGGLAGHPDLGKTLGGLAGGAFIPLQAGPQFAPQGLGGLQPDYDPQSIWNIVKQAAQVLPHVIKLLPLAAGPQQQFGQQQFAPQGVGGLQPDFDPQSIWSIVKKAAEVLPHVVKLLPLAAGPQQQFAPQGLGGDLISQIAQTVGGHVGGGWGQALEAAAPFAKQYIPFQAGPQQQLQPQFDPQSIWSIVKQAADVLPHVIKLLPLAAGPQQQFAPQQFAPQSIFGNNSWYHPTVRYPMVPPVVASTLPF